jgi:putative AbiEii toxin of type IV toxin-antitoxin system
VVDEPEVYLHPDVQRQLLSILRNLGPAVVLATHSTEIMSEADPSEIVLIDKAARAGERLKDDAGVQVALELVGSLQNVTLTRLARSRRVVFVEGEDFRLIAKFASTAGLAELAAGTNIVPVSIEGFSGWERIRSIAWGINRTLGTSLLIATVLDRDFFPAEQILEVRASLAKHAQLVHIHERKEFENYLLVPAVIERAIASAQRSSPTPVVSPDLAAIEALLTEITDPLKNDVLGQLIAKRWAYMRSSGVDQAIMAAETASNFESQWKKLELRLKLVPGKDVLKRIREVVQDRYGVTLSNQRILSAFRKNDIPG